MRPSKKIIFFFPAFSSQEATAPLVADCFDDVIVSLDGPPAIHDQIRGVPRAFDRLAQGVKSLRQLRPQLPLQARTTVQRANCAQLRETVRTAKDLKLDSILLPGGRHNLGGFQPPRG